MRHKLIACLLALTLGPLLSQAVTISQPRTLPPRATAAAAASGAVLTQHNDNGRTGADLTERMLTTATVSVHTFGKLFTRAVNGQIYAQPLYVPHLSIPRQGTHNVVVVATMHNSVYAYDADDPAASRPLWHDTLEPAIPLPDPLFSGRFGPFHDIQREVGIVSTPVIDARTQTLYVVTASKAGGLYTHHLHALDLRTGREKFGGPVAIQAPLRAGTTMLIFNNLRQLQRPGLLLSGGVVYLAFGSYADADPFHGWILGYDARTLRQVVVFTATPTGTEGGIWQGGQGLAADARGAVYAATSNGTWDGHTNFGNSVLKLAPATSTVADWFTPATQAYLTRVDLDLGSSGVVLLPGTPLLVAGGKQGILYVLNREHLGHATSRIQQGGQQFQATSGPLFGSPVYWDGPAGGLLYVWGDGDYLKAYAVVDGHVQTRPVAQSTMHMIAPTTVPGGVLSLSAQGRVAGSGILWAIQPSRWPAQAGGSPGILRAFDAADVHRELWDSTQDAARDAVGAYAKFNPPTIANGKVYVGTFSGTLDVYGLLGRPR